jgi:chromosome segregation ATPase
MSTNVARPTPKPSHIVKLPLVSNHDENARLKTQVATLTAEKADLHQQLAKQGHAYRGCQLDLDETKEGVADLQAMLKSAQDANTDLRAAMKNILDVAAAQKL